jgi:hypothetical protein
MPLHGAQRCVGLYLAQLHLGLVERALRPVLGGGGAVAVALHAMELFIGGGHLVSGQ